MGRNEDHAFAGLVVWRRRIAWLCCIALLSCFPLARAPGADAAGTPETEVAHFSGIRYRAFDPDAPVERGKSVVNPILPGFHPDPSIVRAGRDFYLVNSSFAWFPGIPIFHSRDLVHWALIGNAIDRPSQLDFSGLNVSGGVFAPDISFKAGRFYIANTCFQCGWNYVISATDPKGPWSDPKWFGRPYFIDPAIFSDRDGKSYVVSNGLPEGPSRYEGHRAIWLQRIDLKTGTLLGDAKVLVDGGVDIAARPQHIEGPHLYWRKGYYYLIAAEGGTGDFHSEVAFRSKKLFGPYVPFPGNPILTQRDLPADRDKPVTSAGHAELFETGSGKWWAVFLATRPYRPGLYNIGRETFLLPVTWRSGWPIILPRGRRIPRTVAGPGLPIEAPSAATFDPGAHDGFGSGTKALEWISLRIPRQEFLSVSADGGAVDLTALQAPLGDVHSSPAFVGLRQSQAHAVLSADLRFLPAKEGGRAGLAAIQSDDSYAFCGIVRKDGQVRAGLITRARGAGAGEEVQETRLIELDSQDVVGISLEIRDGRLDCHSTVEGSQEQKMDFSGDATFLSTREAGGFVGTIMGLYAHSGR